MKTESTGDTLGSQFELAVAHATCLIPTSFLHNRIADTGLRILLRCSRAFSRLLSRSFCNEWISSLLSCMICETFVLHILSDGSQVFLLRHEGFYSSDGSHSTSESKIIK